MYNVVLYETPAGNCPIDKFIGDLVHQHKDEALTKFKAMIEGLEKDGLEKINTRFNNACKYLRDGIYELRPKPNRILFFSPIGKTYVLLHAFEKKCNQTPPEEIRLAIKEKNEYLNRNKKK